jgi:hypothetical protein
MGGGGDLECKLLAESCGKGTIAIGDDKKRAWSANYIGAIPVLNSWFAARGYGEPIYGKAV